MAVTQISSEKEIRTLLEADKPVLVDFWKENCGTCSLLKPVVEEIARERTDIYVYGVNAEQLPTIASRFSVMVLPSLLLIDKGKVVKRTLGFKSKEHLNEMLDQNIH